MDPLNTYVMGGNMVTGRVDYYKGEVEGPDFSGPGTPGYIEQYGGGRHVPAARIITNSSVTLSMYRYSEGPDWPDETSRGTRLSTSHHPEGQFVFVRITK